MSDPINRAQFLRGDLRGKHLAIRPPWARSEALFVEQCVRCDDCIASCGQRIIKRGVEGFPQIDFSQGACTFCGDCVRACQPAALAFGADLSQPPWYLSVTISADCLAQNAVVCRSCSDRCDEAAIRFQLQTRGRAIPVINQDSCNGCGDCFSACPTGSLRIRPQSLTQAA